MKKLTRIIIANLCSFATATAFAESPAPNDAQIAGIVVAANTVDINAGKLAEKMSHNQEVQALAKQMETDHSAVNKQATALVKKLHVMVLPRFNGYSVKSGLMNIVTV